MSKWLRWLFVVVPAHVRARHGEELICDIEEMRGEGVSVVWIAFDLVRMGATLRIRALLGGSALTPGLRLRHGVSMALWSGLLVVLGGIGFQRNTEHWASGYVGSAVLTPRVLYGATAIFGGGLLLGAILVALIMLPSAFRQLPVLISRIGRGEPVLVVVQILAIMGLLLGRGEWVHLLGASSGGGFGLLGAVFVVLVTGVLMTVTHTAWRVLKVISLPAGALWWVGAAATLVGVLEVLVSLSALGWQIELAFHHVGSVPTLGIAPPSLGVALVVMTFGCLGALRAVSELADVLLGPRPPRLRSH